LTLLRQKNEQFSMDDFGEKKPFSICFLFIWGESAEGRLGGYFSR